MWRALLVLVSFGVASPLAALTFKMNCQHQASSYYVVFNTDKRKLFSNNPVFDDQLRVHHAQRNAQSGDWIVWALLSTVSGASRDVVFSFGDDNWIKNFWANGSVSRVDCDALD